MWADVLDGIHATALDCLRVNLAVLADLHHGAGTHLRLGTRPRFTPRFGAGLPTVERAVGACLDEARARLGLAVAERTDRCPAGELGAVLADGRTRYVVADAYRLPWLPYFTERHMEHSFLTTADADGVLVVDAYRNDTHWGSARPGTWLLTADELGTALAGGITTVVRLEPVRLPDPEPAGGDAHPVDVDVVRRYVAAYRDLPDRRAAFEQLAVETWLLARDSLLYATAVGGTGAAGRAEGWKRLAERTYLALRRVERARPEPPGIFDDLSAALLADAVADPGADQGSAPGPAGAIRRLVERTVLGTVGDVLGVAPDRLAGGGSLHRFPGFNSFRMVDVLEQIERALDVEVPGEQLTPENLSDVTALCALFARCLGEVTADV